MLIEWLATFEYCRRRTTQVRRNPLEDPLERPEWDGLRWIVELPARWRARRRRARTAAPDAGAVIPRLRLSADRLPSAARVPEANACATGRHHSR